MVPVTGSISNFQVKYKLHLTGLQISNSKDTGTDVYVVGGFVRDQLLELDFKKDLDFVVLGSGLEFSKQFAQ